MVCDSDTATLEREVSMNVLVSAWQTASGTQAISCSRVSSGRFTSPTPQVNSPSSPPTPMYSALTVTGWEKARSRLLL